MPFDVINTGTTANDGTGDPLRTAFTKTNDNFGKAVEAATSATDGRVVVFDGATGNKVKNGAKAEADLVVGPASATSGRVAVYNGTTGKLLQNGTKLETDLVTGPASATSGRVAVYNGTTGKVIQDGTKLEADLVAGPASATSGRVAVYNGTTGKLLQNGTKLEADLVAGPASATSGRVAVYNGTTGKLLQNGTKLETDLVTGPASVTADRMAVFNSTTGKVIKEAAFTESDVARLSQTQTFSGTKTFTAATTSFDGSVAARAASTASAATQIPVFTADPASTTRTVVTRTPAQLIGDMGGVVGPASATANRVAVFDGTTGKLLKDGTKLEADLVTGPASSVNVTVPVFNGTTGKVIKNTGVVITDNNEIHSGAGSASRPGYSFADFDTGMFNASANVLAFSTGGNERLRIDSSGNVGIGGNNPLAVLHIFSNSFILQSSSTPASAGAAGNKGEIRWDDSYLYVCVDVNTWKRAELLTW